jgi:CheY-like chemotaxis protein
MLELSQLRVVVVEDDEDVRFLLKAFLNNSGALVDDFDSAEPALEAIAKAEPDVIISDLWMPKHNGYWLIEHVRQLQPGQGRDTPAIALTASTNRQERVRVLSAGFQLYMLKPPVPDQLIAAIRVLAGPARRASKAAV